MSSISNFNMDKIFKMRKVSNRKVTNVRNTDDKKYINKEILKYKENLERYNDKKCINKEERLRHLPGYCP